MSALVEELRFRLAGLLGQGLVGGLFSTVRLRRANPEAHLRPRRRGENVIFVFWHDQLLPLVWVHRNEGIVVLVSEHDDGEYIARLLERYGCSTVRGSSTRGGASGTRGLVRAAREGKDLALATDGPRGPRHRVKDGALLVAGLTGLPLVPIGVSAEPAWRLPSWDRFLVPKPFSTVAVVWGEPIRIHRDASRAELRERARGLEGVLSGLTRRAEEAAGRRRPDTRPGKGERAQAS